MKRKRNINERASIIASIFLTILLIAAAPLGAQEKSKTVPLANRIGHSDPSRAMVSKNVHQGAGTLQMQTLLGRGAITGLNFMHHGPLGPKSSIGHHFHTNSDEMFLILDADCEFTVNGRTALLKGPVGVPCSSGNSHAVYNPSAKPADWVNFNVAVTTSAPVTTYATPAAPSGTSAPPVRRGGFNYSADPTGTFDIGDDRVGVTLDKKPTFISTGQLTKASLRPVAGMNGGKDTVFYRRALGPGAFVSNWAFVDHLLIPVGASVGRHYHAGVDEVYFVIKGKGKVYVNDEWAEIAYGDAVPVKAGEIHSLESSANEPLEMIVYGVALEKGKLDVVDVPLTMAKLQMFFEVEPKNFEAFEKNYIEVYVPALRKQVGYLGSKLLRRFPDDFSRKIGSPSTNFNFEMELMFDTEEHRQAWTKTKEHDEAWPKTAALAKAYQWFGYDVVGMDQSDDPLGKRNVTTEKQK
ncbi:MAG TPA: cupin domain-containing protein [Bacteroidales bacterium]|nr:cupin domain-containing protein [Bacteroidales bacterium]HRR93342.1 cupin domain-containing protein [Bacteroidales bacterium]HRT88487.1 cupin domain-containing protein [Bacteroidales bacterium]